MIPDGRLSSEAVPARYAGGRAVPELRPTRDSEDGGVGLNNPAAGLLVRVWHGITDGTQITVWTDGVTPTVIVTDTDITEISFTFDQNMNYACAYVSGGVTKLKWFDVTVNSMVTTTFGEDYFSPRVTLDDKHRMATGSSDIIFAYFRDGALCYRQQRDRYATEYELQSGFDPQERLRRVGMNAAGRLQFEHYLLVPEIVE